MANEKIITVILGSSNAEGYGASSIDKSWARLLKKESLDSIINLSKAGYTSYDFLPDEFTNIRNIKPDPLRNITRAIKLNPKIIIFSITSNDIARGYSIDEYINNIEILTNLCVANNIEFIVTSTLPRNDLSFQQRENLYKLNGKLKDIYDYKFVDIYDSVANLETYTWLSTYVSSDNIHPNDDGHLNIFNNIWANYSKIRNRLLGK